MDKAFCNTLTDKVTRLFLELECTNKAYFSNPKKKAVEANLVKLLEIICNTDYALLVYGKNLELTFPISISADPIENWVKDIWFSIKNYGLEKFISEVKDWRYLDASRSIYNNLVEVFGLDTEAGFEHQTAQYVFNEFSKKKTMLISKGFSQS